MSLGGKLVNSYTPNACIQSNFSGFEIVTCREIRSLDGGTIIEEVKTAEDFVNVDELALDSPFYRVFGVYKNEIQGRKMLGDFYSPKYAEEFISDLTGMIVHTYSY
jgi:hypothetical protein